jgi:[acyl-carrier-protein] S-malonyltransferase
MTSSMSDIAFLFPGQGSQAVGMGKALADTWPAARQVFEEADDALGFAISKLCFEGPEEQLRLTENTQPALLTVSIAAFRVLEQQGFRPAFVAGHSLGEYSALVAAGSLQFRDALRLVRNRGRYMQEAVPPGVGAMAAVLKPPMDKLEQILAEAAQGETVAAANFNSPDQVVIAGHAGAVARASEALKTAGAKRVVPLPVSAPFHCPLMRPAQERLKADLDATPFADLAVPLVNNVDAEVVATGADAREGLYRQVSGAVRWTDSMRKLVGLGMRRAVEVGAGAVLCGLLKQIAPEVRTAKFGDPADLDKVRELLG